jgi:predicted metalloprotease with PDZ domain
MKLRVLIALSLGLLAAAEPKQEKAAKPAKIATFGAKVRTPSSEEVKQYGLTRLKHSPNGLFVTAIDTGGAADKAGLKKGDVLLALDENKMYSQDDLDDFLRVSHPGSEVQALVKRADSLKEEKVTVTLQAAEKATDGSKFTWQYASLGQLDKAIAAAKKDGKPVFIGLSGADT